MNIDEIKSRLKARGVTILNSKGKTFSFRMPQSKQTYRLELRVNNTIHFSPVPPKNLSDKVYFTSRNQAITAMRHLHTQAALNLPVDEEGRYFSDPLSTRADVNLVSHRLNDKNEPIPHKAKIIIPMKHFEEMLPRPKSLAASPPPAPKAGGSKPTPPSKSSQSLERLHVFDFDGTLATCKVNHVMGWKLKKSYTSEFADLAGSSPANTPKKIKRMLDHQGMVAKPTKVMGKLREVAQSETEDFAIATYNCCPDVIADMISEAMTGEGSNFEREELADNTRTIGTIQSSLETKEVEKTPVEIKAYGYKIPGTNIRFRVIAPKVTPEMVEAYKQSKGRVGLAGYDNLIKLDKKEQGYPKTKMVEFAAEASTCPVNFYDDSSINTRAVAQSRSLQSRAVEVFHCANGVLTQPAASALSGKGSGGGSKTSPPEGAGGGSKKLKPHPAALKDEEIIKWLSEKIGYRGWHKNGEKFTLIGDESKVFPPSLRDALQSYFPNKDSLNWAQTNQGHKLNIPKTELQKIAGTIRNDLTAMKQAEPASPKGGAAQKGLKTQKPLPSNALGKATSATHAKVPEKIEKIMQILRSSSAASPTLPMTMEKNMIIIDLPPSCKTKDQAITFQFEYLQKLQTAGLGSSQHVNSVNFKKTNETYKVYITVNPSLLEETSNESKKGDSNPSPRPGGSGASRV